MNRSPIQFCVLNRLQRSGDCQSRLPRVAGFRPAMSIIEIMLFITILLIAVVGTSGYRYFSSLDIRRSDSEITAGRIALQLCESWKGIGGGDSNYNPINDPGIGLDITDASSTLASQAPLNFTLLKYGGYYKVRVLSDNDKDVRTYYATMSYHTAISANGNLETLNVIVTWPASESSLNNDVTTKKSLCLSELLIVH